MKRAKADDEVTFEMVVEAVNNAGACMEGVDAKVFWLDPDISQGFPVPTYKYGADSDRLQSEWLPVAEECLRKESGIVEWLYQTQPAVTELAARYYREVRRPVIVACLEEHGVAVPASATQADIDLIVQELYFETSGTVWTDNGDGSKSGNATTPENAVNCDWDTR